MTSLDGINRVPSRLVRKMANSARTVNQNQRNTLINNRPMGALAFGPLIEDGVMRTGYRRIASLNNGIQQFDSTHQTECLLPTNPYRRATYPDSAVSC